MTDLHRPDPINALDPIHLFDKPLAEDFTDADLEVKKPMDYAVGIEAVEKAMLPMAEHLGVEKTAKLSLTVNHKKGFDCPSCAWANPDHSKTLEFCENGIKNIVWDATPVVIEDAFWAENSLTSMLDKSEYWLGLQGRITKPMYKAADSDHYVPISWSDALDKVAEKLRGLDSPDEAVFYTSGRIMNEPAFLLQLFARALGTNNLPDCSNMCHEATGSGMTPAIGIGKSSVHYDDFAWADLVIVMGQNPGTNHPRMLNALEDTKTRGGRIVAVNTLPEASLKRYKNPQKVSGELGTGEQMADQFVQIKIGGDQHLLQAVAKRLFEAEEKAPGTVLDHDFIRTYCNGFDAYREHIMAVDESGVLAATGLTSAEIDELAQRYIDSNATIITWALGITQHKKAVATIAEIMNLLLLRGNIGKKGAGASPIRGHSNVQGDRTMGIWEKISPAFAAAMSRQFAFEVPTEPGLDSVDAMNAMEDGKVKVFMSMAGNLIAAMSDSGRSEAGVREVDLTIQVATKLNRSHVVTGKESLLLPATVRAERDVTSFGLQFLTSEDTVCRINMSHGELKPVSDDVRSDVWILCELGKRLFSESHPGIPWAAFQEDYDAIRDAIAHVVPGFEDFNARVKKDLTFVLPHPPRDSRTFPTPSGRAEFTIQDVEHVQTPEGRLMMQSMRAHDQHNTTMYSLSDRYRGIHKGRFVLFIHPDDLAARGLADGDTVDIFSEWPGEPDRVLRGYRAVSYPTVKGCVAAYFPEANALVPRGSVADICNTPTSKQIVVRVEKGELAATGGRPVTI
ncbi:FdhF/YdeP family oxidoreductase [Microbacterium aoyamense]|uniref:FdhF/YdeP family oxidoreductase n=1 Tax=Microbacterium aoyamense TaxID=344166 RepID=A0ABP5BAU9_9MICO